MMKSCGHHTRYVSFYNTLENNILKYVNQYIDKKIYYRKFMITSNNFNLRQI